MKFISSDLERVREGIGDKLSLLLQAAACCSTGFLIGFLYNWRMTLVSLFCYESLTLYCLLNITWVSKVDYQVLMVFVPIIALTTAWIGRTATVQSSVEQAAYGVANSIAQQAFSSVRTVFSLNGSRKEIKRLQCSNRSSKL